MRSRHALLALILIGCSRPSLQQLYDAGYQDVERGFLQAALSGAEEGAKRADKRREPLWAWRFQVLRAEALLAMGRSADALALQTPNRSEPDPADVRALIARGRARCLAAKSPDGYRQAETDLAEARRMAHHLGSSKLAGEVALCLGTCASRGGSPSAAATHFREALATARQEKLSFLEARATGSLGLLGVRTERYDDGASWLRRSLDLAVELRAESTMVKTLNNLGWCYYKLGDYDRALEFLLRGESLATDRGFRDDLHRILTNVGNVHYSLGDFGRATDYYRRAQAITRELGDMRYTADALSNLGIVAIERARYDEAEGYVEEAARIDDETGNVEGRQHSLRAQGQILAGRRAYPRAEAIYQAVIRSPHTVRELLWETRALLADLLAKTGRDAEAEAEFRDAFALMEDIRKQLQVAEHKISFFSGLDRYHDSFVRLLIDQQRVAMALDEADRCRARLLHERLGKGNVPAGVGIDRLHRTARTLDAVLLSYWLTPERSFLWLVTPRKLELHVLPGEGEIRTRVERHLELTVDSRDLLEEGARDAEWLYRTLVGPAEPTLSTASRVVVVPDGVLHWLNFETLVVPSPQRHYWIEDVTVATAPSLALLAAGESSPPPRRPRNILIIGDPVPANEEFPRLRHAADEIQSIAGKFEPSKRRVLSGAQAESSVYKTTDPGRFAFIHFATHAKANPMMPLDSAVILSPMNDSYKLYAREIVDVRPLRAELVTLSACRSAGSRNYSGEGLVGLAWAFMSAGAGNVIAGLWNVEDSSTSDLMGHLYSGLLQGSDPAEALRAAKLRLLRSDSAFNKPYYWAPFMVYTQRTAAARTP